MNKTGQLEERQAATDLVHRIRHGDDQAETELVKRYTRGLRFLLHRRTRDPQAAEDLLQETWAIALKKLRNDGLHEPGRLVGYLRGIASNLALNENRRLQRQKTTVDSRIIELIPDDSFNPFRQVSRAEVCRQVHQLLEELEVDRDREILTRFYVHEEDKESICGQLGLDRVHFNRVIYRARQRFRKSIEPLARREQFHVVN